MEMRVLDATVDTVRPGAAARTILLLAGAKPSDQNTDRIDGPLKTTGTVPYAYEQHDAAPNAAVGYVVGSATR